MACYITISTFGLKNQPYLLNASIILAVNKTSDSSSDEHHHTIPSCFVAIDQERYMEDNMDLAHLNIISYIATV
jgi:hypothetical protein